jgi:MFS family permease
MLKNRKTIAALLANVATYIATIYLDPILSVHLVSLGLAKEYTGFAFACNGLSLALGSPLAGYLCDRLKYKYIMAGGLLVNVVALLFIGPIDFLPNQYWVIMVGMLIIGLSQSLLGVPAIPEIIAATSEHYKDHPQELEIMQG